MNLFAPDATYLTTCFLMQSKTLTELAVIELENRPRTGDFPKFCASKGELNNRGFMCAACSKHHHYSQGHTWGPCSGCKGKLPVPTDQLPKETT